MLPKTLGTMVLVFLSGFFIRDAVLAQPDGNNELAVNLTVAYKGGQKHIIKVSMENKGKDFECPLAQLPWSHWHSMTLILVTANGQVLETQQWIDDPLLGDVTIKRGELVTGEISLLRRFPKINEVIAKDGADLFWSFQLTSPDGRRSKRVGGWTYIPRMK